MMRPTWHFVSPADIRWILALTGRRVRAACAAYFRKMELDDRVLTRTAKIIGRTLESGRHLTRPALAAALETSGIPGLSDNPLRMSFVMLYAELEGLVCSGPRVGKQFTYALLDERVPPTPALDRDESLAALVERYFTSHGPAAVRDFAWWSGLTMADGKRGLDMVKPGLGRETIDGEDYWSARAARRRSRAQDDGALLLPPYDESLLSYRDNRRGESAYGPQVTRDNGAVIVLGGRPAGTWRRTLGRTAGVVEVTPFTTFSRSDNAAISAVVARYGAFMNLPFSVACTERDAKVSRTRKREPA
jgi:hypothetical protein